MRSVDWRSVVCDVDTQKNHDGDYEYRFLNPTLHYRILHHITETFVISYIRCLGTDPLSIRSGGGSNGRISAVNTSRSVINMSILNRTVQ